jgi:hypothetical protein
MLQKQNGNPDNLHGKIKAEKLVRREGLSFEGGDYS